MTIDKNLRDAMNRLIGTWRSEGHIIDGGDHDGESWAGHDVYEWFPGGQHMVHRVDVEIFGGREEAIEFFTPRGGSTDTFDQISFDSDGSIEHAVGSFDADGRYHNVSDGMRAVLDFEAPDHMRAKWEQRLPDGIWVDWMLVTFERVTDPHIEVRSKGDHTV